MDVVNEAPGTDHWQIAKGENSEYGAMMSDVEKVIAATGPNPLFEIPVKEIDLNNPPSHSRDVLLQIRWLEQFLTEWNYEKEWLYNERYPFNIFKKL